MENRSNRLIIVLMILVTSAILLQGCSANKTIEIQERRISNKPDFPQNEQKAAPTILGSQATVVQNPYACNWQLELLDHVTKEVKYFRLDPYPLDKQKLFITLQKPEKMINVECTVIASQGEGTNTIKSSQVQILCRYPNGQMFGTSAVEVTNYSTGEKLVSQVHLFFTSMNRMIELGNDISNKMLKGVDLPKTVDVDIYSMNVDFCK